MHWESPLMSIFAIFVAVCISGHISKKAREVRPKQRGRKLCLLKDKFQCALRFSKRVGLKLSQVELNNDKGALTYLNWKMKACKS